MHAPVTAAWLRSHGVSALSVDDLTEADLPGLEWSGSASHLRSVAKALTRVASGEVEYLAVRSPDGHVVAKGGIDFAAAPGAGMLWQLTTRADLQGLGIGTLLVQEAERRIQGRGLSTAVLSVERENVRARALYERLGYAAVGQRVSGWEATLPDGGAGWHRAELVDLRKDLVAENDAVGPQPHRPLIAPGREARRLLGGAVELREVLVNRPDRLVARLSTGAGEVVLKAGPGVLVEMRANDLLRQAGLPVGEVLAWETAGPEVLVLRWIEGRPVSGEDPEHVLVDLGRTLRQIHEIGGGPPYAGGFPGVETWTDWMRGWLSTVLSWGPALGIPEGEVARCWSRFEAVVPTLDEVGFDLILFDGRPEHILTDGASVVGLIDLGDLQAGHSGMDIAVLGIHDSSMVGPLLRGYGASARQREQLRQLVPLYGLLRRLSSHEWNTRLGNPLLAASMLQAFRADPWERFPGL